ncbi:MAG: asparagine synthase [Crenarchaeota archaeon]|jgi:asparagine synthase (glutamine-hydrolysing)|nr:asparagine synthase [Thermoproteota archaeon]
MAINETEVTKLIQEARLLIHNIVKKDLADGFLFSAGTDTQIIVYEAVKYKPDIPCLTLAFKHGQPKDAQYVKMMVDFLNLKHETYQFGKEELMKFYPKVVEALKKYDPMEVRNSLPLYIGLTLFKEKGIKTVFTGDALDELFGYPWQFHLTEEQFAVKQQEMWAEMGFASIPMAKSLGMEIRAPYLDPEFQAWAKQIPIKYKINLYNGVKYGKWILRKAYEDVIPHDAIWRPKAPLEAGTGTETLRTYFNDTFTPEEFKEKVAKIKAEDDVEIADQEQLLYYQHFRKVFGKPKDVFPQTSGAIQCPKCKSWQVTKIQFCKKCGAYPI